jgi:BON domain
MKSRASVYLATVALLAFFAAAVGCTKAPNDAQITSNIQSKLNADSGLQGKQLGVQTSGGSVTLSGTVDNETERDAAARYAASVPGVKQVVNNIQVSPPPADQTAQAQPATPATAPQEMSKPSPSRRETRRHHAEESSDQSEEAQANPPADQASSDQPSADQPSADQTASAPPASVAEQTPAAAPAPPPPPPQEVTIPSGTTISVRLIDPLNSATAQQGQTFRASLNAPLTVNGQTAIPAGYDVVGHVVAVQSAGKFTGQSTLTLQLDRLSVNGKHYNIQTDEFHRETVARGRKTAEKVGIGSVLGGVIGAIAGGGKGAAIGAAAGAGVGGGVQAAGKTPEVDLPSETVLSFTLQAPVTVTETTAGPHRGGPQLQMNNQN